MATIFENLGSVNTKGKTSTKNRLTYLSWTYAWAETCKIYPEATYTIEKFANNLPYVYDENTGYMVFTTVTIEGLTHEMWLFVMDGANKSLKAQPYTYKVKNKGNWDNTARRYVVPQGEPEFIDKAVEACSMFDVNKTIMRCLVKNLAMFGLGINIYAGEDLPLVEAPKVMMTVEHRKSIYEAIDGWENESLLDKVLERVKVIDFDKLEDRTYERVLEIVKEEGDKWK